MKHLLTILSLSSILAFVSCEEPGKDKDLDTTVSGTINIYVDETYEPIIKEQLRVFDSSYPEAHIIAHYASETACFRAYLNDSARLILVTRELSPEEKKFMEKKRVLSSSLAIAKDAVAVILNNESPDSLLSISALKGILTDSYKKKYSVVFDNQGSSTLRYMTDSILKGQGKFGPNVFAAKGNDSVLDYVRRNPNAIGFVGVSYVSDLDDPAGLAFIKNVKVAQVYNDNLGDYYAPYQIYIAPNKYPLTRSLYYIHNETYPGLGTGFASFLATARGQLIFKQARLFPLRTNIIFREATLNQ